MNKQEVFDKITTHLLTQKKRSSNGTGMCMYRGDSGTACAIGCLMTDEAYANQYAHAVSNIEGQGPSHPGVHAVLAASGIDYECTKNSVYTQSEDERFLKKLQKLHDEDEVAGWKESLASFALNEGLEFNPPTEVQ